MSCDAGFVLMGGACRHFERLTLHATISDIAHCKIHDVSILAQPNRDGTGCEGHVVWWVILIVLFFSLSLQHKSSAPSSLSTGG